MNNETDSAEETVKILIVENTTQAESLLNVLDRHGYDVLAAESGQQALDLIDEQRPTLVISDIVMPEMDGYELCQRIKSDKKTGEIPVILLASLTKPENVLDGLSCGADGFITKPYKEDYLLANIEQILTNERLRKPERARIDAEILFAGKQHFITADRRQMLSLLISSYEAAIHLNKELSQARDELRTLNERRESMAEDREAVFSKEIVARDQKQSDMEMEFSASEERMHIAIESSPIGIRINKQDGRLVYVNPALVKMFGYNTADEILGLAVEDLFAPEHRDFIKQKQKNHFSGIKAPFHSELMGIRKNGELFDVKNYVAKMNYEGEPAILVFVIDVSSEKKLEAQYLQSQKMEAIGQLAGGVAHDFNNLLTSIIGYGELLLQGIEDDSLREDLKEIITAGERAAALTRQLLAFSRKQSIMPAVLNLNDIITNLNKMLTRLIGEDIEIATSLAPDLMSVKVDPTQVEQILMNLLINAKDAMPTGGRISIETANAQLDESYALNHGVEIIPGPYVLLKIGDTGCGMSKEIQAKIFEPFFTTKEKGRGTGLGLSTVYGIVKQNKGYIWVYSESDKGTTFKIYLPISEGKSKSLKIKSYRIDELNGNETILFVEDDESLRALARKVLVKLGYTVFTAQDGDEAISLFKAYQDQIQLVITDVVMPIMSGRDLADVLRSLKTDLKVMYMSGYSDNTILGQEILEDGIQFIEKPFSSESLAQKVRLALDLDNQPE